VSEPDHRRPARPVDLAAYPGSPVWSARVADLSAELGSLDAAEQALAADRDRPRSLAG